jgi:hypothetical protein
VCLWRRILGRLVRQRQPAALGTTAALAALSSSVSLTSYRKGFGPRRLQCLASCRSPVLSPQPSAVRPSRGAAVNPGAAVRGAVVWGIPTPGDLAGSSCRITAGAPSSATSGPRTSSTRFDTPSFRPPGSGTSGRIDCQITPSRTATAACRRPLLDPSCVSPTSQLKRE